MDENFIQVLKFHAMDMVTVLFPDEYNFLITFSVFAKSYVLGNNFRKRQCIFLKMNSN
jgi:hypothetical protein